MRTLSGILFAIGFAFLMYMALFVDVETSNTREVWNTVLYTGQLIFTIVGIIIAMRMLSRIRGDN